MSGDLFETFKTNVSQMRTKYTSKIELHSMVNSALFVKVVENIVEDFVKAYTEKGTSKYEAFQLNLFQGIHEYLYSPGVKHELVKDLFPSLDKEHLTYVFPMIHHIICSDIHKEIITYLSKSGPDTKSVTLDLEEESELYKMYGWALFELKKKGIHTNILDSCSMSKLEKESLGYLNLKNLDVGCKTGLTFPKKSFMDFMKTSDLFIRQQISEDKFMIYGSNIIDITKTLTQNNMQLQDHFQKAVLSCCRCDRQTILDIYKAWIEKYLNMKLKGRFGDAAERLDVAKNNKLSTKTQNLRDKLLTHHVG